MDLPALLRTARSIESKTKDEIIDTLSCFDECDMKHILVTVLAQIKPSMKQMLATKADFDLSTVTLHSHFVHHIHTRTSAQGSRTHQTQLPSIANPATLHTLEAVAPSFDGRRAHPFILRHDSANAVRTVLSRLQQTEPCSSEQHGLDCRPQLYRVSSWATFQCNAISQYPKP